MIELPAAEVHAVRPLFAPLMAHQLFCAGVVEGRYTGRVFVDDAANPRSGFIVREGMWWFLAGDARNTAFCEELHTALFDRTVSGAHGWGGMLVCHPGDWDARIPMIFAPHIPITTQRRHYLCRHLQSNWQDRIPAGFEIRFVDQSLIEDGIDVQGAAANVLKLRQGTAEPDRTAIGFVALHNRTIVASSVIDCIVGNGGDIGLFTEPGYRRRNLAYLTAAAVIEYALAHAVDVVHWNCESFNTGSIRTAEKLGLQFSHTHAIHTLILNPVRHELNRAWAYLDAGQYEHAIGVCRQQITSGNKPVHPEYYYILARCRLAAGDADQAVQTLEHAVNAGWDSIDELQSDFAVLAARPEWPHLLDRVRLQAATIRN